MAYIFAMSQHKKIDKDNDISTEIDLLAERYLDLWQNNLRHWATDPKALEKWLTKK